MQLIDGKKIASDIRKELKEKIDKLKSEGKSVPGLVAILVGDNPASQIYVASKSKACEEIGMRTKVEKFPSTLTEKELVTVIEKYNADKNYHGILVQLPLPKHINENKIIEAISPKKDVDGFHPMSVGNLVIGNETFVSCTPAGIQELLKRYYINTKGKHVVVVGRSNIVGKPIANLMLQKNDYANSIVTVCHSAASDLSFYTKQADILIAAIGQPEMIKGDMVKEGVVVIDVGINRIEDKVSSKGYRIVGDVAFNEVAPKSSYITPVPGGVGPMTIAMLLTNTFKAYKLYGE
ncbi:MULTISPECIES: bifunctional methylenetetrahydrofolate dehydrogenase/methenyltetrahydrofolate cyclohydrolase FolD [Ignavibacterium]|uniref:bifunctional methylenetetrahydrofolate dehydrogenase/methenyltetrahydrofolate cyclohydrolase FolD n=1 Tax=Ignavibacterium TaxID=795750 RepID=UPI0025B8E970|nr:MULTISPECIES: bifunctional methylenetetrahydrofolate dehydrogenase/methenyltetrahydrofolate cyclohydrolase FolD [Ignavibacterium]